MPIYCCPIAGAFYHPPAFAILHAAPINTPLILRPEPTNPHDPNAIAVFIASNSIPLDNHQKLSEELAGYGFSLEEFLESPEWHIGYIPRNIAAFLTIPEELPGTLSFDGNGKPLAMF